MIFNIFAYWDQVSPRDPILEKDMIPENNQIPFEGSDSLEDPDLNFEDPIRESCKESGLLDPTFWDSFQH